MDRKRWKKIYRIKHRKPNHPNIDRNDFYRYYDYLICYVIFDENEHIKENWISQIKKRCQNIFTLYFNSI